MLKINLLPIRQLKKRAKARNQIVAAIVVFFSVIAILGLVGVIQASRISSLNEEIASKTKVKRSFDKVVKELAALEKKRIDLNNKIGIINQLRADSSLTVRVLDEIAKMVDKNRMWLTQLKQSGSNLSLNGFALDNETIAEFMDNMKINSPFITDVSLTNSKLATVSGKDLKAFSLTCSVATPTAETEKTDETQEK